MKPIEENPLKDVFIVYLARIEEFLWLLPHATIRLQAARGTLYPLARRLNKLNNKKLPF